MPPTSAPGIHEAALQLLANEPRGHLVEAATGAGTLVPRLIELGFVVEACDINPEAYKLTTPPCRAVDLNQPLPFPDSGLDVIVCLEALEHLTSPRHTLREFGRVLRPGGCLILSTPNVQSLVSRLHFFLVGTLDFFDTLRPGDPPSFWLRGGHISPIHYPVLQHALREAGFTIEAMSTNRPALQGVAMGGGRRFAAGFATATAAPFVRWATRRQYPGDPVGEAMCSFVLLHGEILILRARRDGRV